MLGEQALPHARLRHRIKPRLCKRLELGRPAAIAISDIGRLDALVDAREVLRREEGADRLAAADEALDRALLCTEPRRSLFEGRFGTCAQPVHEGLADGTGWRAGDAVAQRANLGRLLAVWRTIRRHEAGARAVEGRADEDDKGDAARGIVALMSVLQRGHDPLVGNAVVHLKGLPAIALAGNEGEQPAVDVLLAAD